MPGWVKRCIMKRNHLYILLVIALPPAIFLSCSKDRGQVPVLVKAPDCGNVIFSKDIKPILDIHCVGCHSANFIHGDLETHSEVKFKVDDGTLLQKVVKDKTMPPGNPLTEEEIQKFKCWIEDGAKDN